ncbi:amino acid adenylation domain-containing protein [Streptomyces sp. GESEQ-4]|uniref:amino acid adenylation domain-containing protein n=1 Tax=Streptomyces sp. GESEQ-4 TaxID=2812655 RepID=UPI001FF08BCB|nr:amino acid adenylation domain-containing protein [Streptomyces sp. GESEQ-4]
MRPDPEWTAGPPNTAPDEGLHETFARRALARPHAVALIESERTTTYAALNADADAWAAQLTAAGVSAGSLVPVLLPRSTELVTALLAVLKTGAAYALLSPDWPEPRIKDVLQELGPPLLIAAAGRTAPEDSPVRVWSPPDGQAAAPPDFRPASVDAGDPCCVFFTSGTTGRPKGVLSPHRATARLFQQGGIARFTDSTVMPLAAAIPWDAFSLELWSVLLNGGTSLVVTDPYLSPVALADAVARHGADTAWLTSSLFNMIVDEAPDAFRGIRQLAIGGERLSAAHVRRFLRDHPDVVLLNGYGPVECTVFATTHRITEADCDRPGGIPLGRPVPGTQIHVLDGARPCAVRETGEICLAGDGLALGYLGDTALTDAKFTCVRIDGHDVRIYRTGDLGYWDEDGLLHYQGRADRQLKIRGHRVEPAEVERQVEQLVPEVRHCRVLARGDASLGERELVAFCVPVRAGDPLDSAPAVLHDALVPYQRPAVVVSVDAFPVTAQGKLDERALLALAPAAAPAVASAAEEAASPSSCADVRPADLRDPVVRAVAEAFATALDREVLPLDVPFVALGGTSLGAGRLCARLSARLNRPVAVSWLYRHPTVHALAGRLRDAPVPLPAPSADAHPADIPLSPMQLVYVTKQLIDPADRTGHCLLTWVIEGDLDPDALEEAISAVHERHEALRAAYLLDPRPAVRVVDMPPPPLEVLPDEDDVDAALCAARGELAGELALDEGEVWRTVLVPVAGAAPGRATAVFGCVVHHVAFDGWSEGVLAGDLSAAYRSALRSGSAALPAGPTLAAVFLECAARRQETVSDAQRDYFRSELTDAPVMRWPSGPVPPKPGSADRTEVVLPASALAGVDRIAQEAGVTRFAVLLSLWAASLSETTGQRDFTVGVPVAQRDGIALQQAVGCHINMVCLRLRDTALDGDTAAVARVAEIASRAFGAQDVAFPDVLALLDRRRDDRPPLYQTLFAYQDNTPPELALHGTTTSLVRSPYLELPLELHAELWPDEHGGLRLDVAFRPDSVTESTARDAAKLFTERVHTTSSGASS